MYFWRYFTLELAPCIQPTTGPGNLAGFPGELLAPSAGVRQSCSPFCGPIILVTVLIVSRHVQAGDGGSAPAGPNSPQVCRLNRRSLILQGKAELQGNLPVGYPSALDVSARVQHLKPPQVAHGCGRLRDRL